MPIFDEKGRPIQQQTGLVKMATPLRVQRSGARGAAKQAALNEQTKMANLSPFGNGADVRLTSPEIRNPLLNLINFYLPYDRRTLNQWIRYYDKFQPVIANCIDLHGEFPMSDFRFTEIEDEKVLDFYENWKEQVDIVSWLFEASREYELIGEVHTFFPWDEDFGYWDQYVTLNPDLLDVKEVNWGYGKSAVYTYDPPQELKQLVQDQDPRVHELLKDLDEVVYENLMAGQQIPLDHFNMVSLMRKSSPYETRGTSPVLRVLKELMYEDKIREAQYAIADQQITPVQLWKIGDAAAGYMPNAQDLQDFRNLLMEGAHDPLFTIVSHGAVNLELIGYTGQLLPVIPEFEWVTERILIGLFTNKAMITGEGPCTPVDTTETLTDRGWLNFDEIDVDRDKIATFNPVTEELEFKHPTGVVCYEYDSQERGQLVEFDHNWLRFLSTPNHRTYVAPGGEIFGVCRADEVKPHDHFKNVVKWQGVIPTDKQEGIQVGGCQISLDSFLTIAGLYLSEGSLEHERKRPVRSNHEWRSKSVYDHLRSYPEETLPNCVRITQTKSTQSADRFTEIENLLLNSGVDFTYREYQTKQGSKGRFEAYGVELAVYLRDEFGIGAVNKRVPNWIRHLPPNYLNVFLRALMLGDGWEHAYARQQEFNTTSSQLADAVQEIALKVGLAARIQTRVRQNEKTSTGHKHNLYRVIMAFDREGERRNSCRNPRLSKHHIKRREFKGRVYCFEVPNHLYVVRSDGTVHVTGNTYSNAVVAMKALQGRYQSKRDKFVKVLKKKLLTAIAKAQKFVRRSEAELAHRVRTRTELMVPDIEWNFKLDLTDETQKIQYLMQLRDSVQMPMKILAEILDFDYDLAMKALKDEEGTVFDPVYQAARQKRAEETGTMPTGDMGGGGLTSPEAAGETGGGPGGEPDETVEPETEGAAA